LLAAISAGESIPIWPGTRIERGDIIRVIGPKDRIEQAGKLLGAAVRSTSVSDILTISLGLAIGYIFGFLSVKLGGIPISLGTPAGVMLAGIAISTLRSHFLCSAVLSQRAHAAFYRTLGLTFSSQLWH
jgi:putative transport protein